MKTLTEEYENTLRQPDNKYHITITYKRKITEEFSRRIINDFFKMVNREYFGRNAKQQTISAFVIHESTKIGNPHAHIIIREHEIMSSRNKDFEAVVRKKLSVFPEIASYNKIGVKFQGYYYKPELAKSLESYLVKSAKNKDFEFLQII